MEDIFLLIVSFLEAILPKRFKEWLFTVSKPFRYTLIGLFYGLAFAAFVLVIVLICWLFNKITGFYL